MDQHRIYRFDDFVVDPESWRLTRDGREVHLEPVVLKLLVFLISNRERLVTRQELMDTVWGDTVISESALSKAVARLRKALGDDSTAPRYLQTVHSQGYRFIAEVDVLDQTADPKNPLETGRRRTRRGRIYAGIIALVALTLLILSWPRHPERGLSESVAIQSLAVLPLSNLTGDPDQDYFVEGLQDILITELSQIEGLRVTSRQSTKRFLDSQLPLTDIAGALGVDALVEGSAFRVGSEVEVTVQLIDGQSDEHLWAKRYSSEASYVFDLFADAARAIGTVIKPAPDMTDLKRLDDDRTGPVDPAATRAYLRGLYHLDRFTEGSLRLAVDQLRAAIEIAPDFALAWGHLAAAHAMQALYGHTAPAESIEKARLAALRAIEADPQFYIGHSTLGWIRLWTRNLEGACQAFQEALRLNPSAPYALHGDADCLMLTGRMAESVERTRRLQLVGPFTVMHSKPLPYHLFIARRYDDAISAALEMQERIPTFSMHWFLALVYWKQGLYERALDEQRLELEWRNDTTLLAALEAGNSRAGPRGAMYALAEVLVLRSKESYADPFEIGEAFARAGSADDALLWLRRAVDQGSFETVYIGVRPDFDDLHSDPRFLELVRQAGLQKDRPR